MTDTVNVPRESINALLDALDFEDKENPFFASHHYDNIRSSMLAAAPKAEPVSDGAHDQWHFDRLGLTSDNILDKMSEAATEIAGWGADNEVAVMRFAMAEITRLSAKPEAPKVEQEPLGYAYKTIGGWWSMRPMASIGNTHGKPLFTHPATASDELLEALEELVADYESEGVTGPLMNCLRDLIAKHKGPQS